MPLDYLMQSESMEYFHGMYTYFGMILDFKFSKGTVFSLAFSFIFFPQTSTLIHGCIEEAQHDSGKMLGNTLGRWFKILEWIPHFMSSIQRIILLVCGISIIKRQTCSILQKTLVATWAQSNYDIVKFFTLLGT